MKCREASVLIIDDSPLLSLQLGQLLQGFGFTARSTSVAEGVPAWSASLGDLWAQGLALIFVELLQTHANGFQLLRHLRRCTRCPLVLLTGSGRAADVPWGLQAGAAVVLSRPLTPAALEGCLRQLQLLPERGA